MLMTFAAHDHYSLTGDSIHSFRPSMFPGKDAWGEVFLLRSRVQTGDELNVVNTSVYDDCRLPGIRELRKDC